MPNAANPQAWNRYAYVLGNPLRYIDPSGNCIVPAYDDYCEFYGDYDVTRDDALDCNRGEYDAFSFEFSKFWANLVKQETYWESHTQVSDTLYWLSGQGRGGDLSLFFGGNHVVGGGAGCIATGPRGFSCPAAEPRTPSVKCFAGTCVVEEADGSFTVPELVVVERAPGVLQTFWTITTTAYCSGGNLLIEGYWKRARVAGQWLKAIISLSSCSYDEVHDVILAGG